MRLKIFITVSFLALALHNGLCQSKGYSLLIGLTEVDSKAYSNHHNVFYDNNATIGVRRDIASVKKIARQNNHEIVTLIDKHATRKDIIAAIEEIGKKVRSGDLFTLYFSGHGDQVIDKSGDEISGLDQVLVAYDDYVLDDEIDKLFNKYFKNTRNAMIVDACHSGTTYKSGFKDQEIYLALGPEKINANFIYQQKRKASLRNCAFGDLDIQSEPYSLIYFGATADGKTAVGKNAGGILTICLAKIWNDANYVGNWNQYTYRQFACEMVRKMEAYEQEFQYREIGTQVKNYNLKLPFKP